VSYIRQSFIILLTALAPPPLSENDGRESSSSLALIEQAEKARERLGHRLYNYLRRHLKGGPGQVGALLHEAMDISLGCATEVHNIHKQRLKL